MRMVTSTLHTEVRWLSLKVTVLTDSMPCTKYKFLVEFLQESDVELCSEVNEISNDVAYVSCIIFSRKRNSRNPGLRARQ